MKNGLLTLFLSLFFVCSTMAQNGQGFVLTGTVHSEDPNEPIAFAKVVSANGHEGAYADENGRFSLKMKEIPEFVLISAIGYYEDTLYRLQKIWPKGKNQFEYHSVLREIEYIGGPVPITVEIEEDIRGMNKISESETRRGDNSSIEQGLNLVPGVKFESRGPGGSRRLAIRGGFLRSPFGVRDVKAYLAGTPLTNPDGSTALELIDPVAIGKMEILKGPWASRYGPVSSGVALLSFEDRPQIGLRGGLLSQSVGSYGYLRSALQVGWMSEHNTNENVTLTLVRQSYAGYRAQEANQKILAQISGNKVAGRHFLQGNATYYQGFWELPGSLDSAEAASNPRQALPVSEAGDAHVERRHLRLAGAHSTNLGKWTRISTNAYFHWTDKQNPFATSVFNQGYKVEQDNSFGGRIELRTYKNFDFQWQFGTEYQVGFLDYQQFENVLGNPGILNTDSKTRSTQAHVFAALEHRLSSKMQLLSDVSLSKVAYLQSEAWSSIETIPLGKTQLAPTPAGSFSWKWRDAANYFRKSIAVRLATGYSPPALWEMTDSLGQFQTDLLPEYGLNGEVKGLFRFFQRKAVAEISLYHHTIWNTIVPQTLNSGRTVFENNGRTTQIGLEMFASAPKIKPSRTSDAHVLALTASGAFQYFRFNEHALDGVSFAGKAIPGVPTFTANFQADWLIKQSTEIQFTQQFVGKSWLNNANTVAQPSYMLLNFKASHRFGIRQYKTKPVGTAVTLSPFVGVNNLLNTRYTNFPNLNAVNGRFWNPAPGINAFGGIDCKF
ncbi:MAG: TonB-dependent receptor plug domain-containing protein [Bacteroidia bacterium]|nr:TonB-dependent receptor plug domain-containing protein [Bacteroidia bacterium]